MSVFCPEKGIDLNRILERSTKFQKPSHPSQKPVYGSVVYIWKVYKPGENVLIEPLQLSPAPDLEDSCCYIVLHTFGEIPRTETLLSFNALTSFCAEAVKVCVPKGLQSRVADSISYDLYQWNGLKAKPEIKSIALGKTYQLNTSLSAIVARLDSSLHSFLIQDVKLIPFTIANERTTSSTEITRSNHLLARVTTQLFATAQENSNSHHHTRKQSIMGANNVATLVTPRTLTLIKNDQGGWLTCVDGAPVLHERKRSLLGTLGSARSTSTVNEKSVAPQNVPNVAKSRVLASLTLDIVQVLEGIEDGAIEGDESQRKQRKLDYFGKICSTIIPNKLYLGSDIVAQDYNLLKKNGITHIINSAGVICKNYFQNDNSFTYKTLYLADGPQEDISCVFYDCYEFVKNALENPNNRVYIHCFQGVSRSATIVFAYLMLANSWSYDYIYTYVRERRAIVEPNTGFMIQLRTFERRLKKGVDVERLYELTPHQADDPTYFVPKVVKNPTKPPKSMYLSINSISLNPITSFVLQHTTGKIYIWKGRKSSKEREDCAHRFANFLKTYEKGKEIIFFEQGSETEEFWNIFEDKGQSFLSSPAASVTSETEEIKQEVKKEKEEKEEEEEEKEEEEICPCMYHYPTGDKIEMFDSDDLDEDSAFLVFDKNRKIKNAFFWIGDDSEFASKSSEEVEPIAISFLKKVFPSEEEIKIQLIGENFDEAEQDFWDLFVC